MVLHGAVSTPERDQLDADRVAVGQCLRGRGWGLSVIEANSLGVPVLAYRRPGMRDSIRDGETGWLDRGGRSISA